MNVHVNSSALRARHIRARNGTAAIRRQSLTKAKNSRFDRLVASYYPAVYSFALRLTDDPWEAVVLTRDAFNSTRKQLRCCRDEIALETILLTAVIRAGLTAACAELAFDLDWR
jgi:DNA-directed RNA polymerase specialized sigma24 family protein